jgi:hypothetical protein
MIVGPYRKVGLEIGRTNVRKEIKKLIPEKQDIFSLLKKDGKGNELLRRRNTYPNL